MLPRSLSATSASVFEACPARWKVEYFDSSPTMSGTAADLGTAVHAALEIWVKGNLHAPRQGLQLLKDIYTQEYWKLFATGDRYDEGVKMITEWWNRTDFTGRTVVSTEVKSEFLLQADGVSVPFRYIWDRCDRIDNEDGTFDIEVVDYKTIAMPVQPEDLKKRIQPKAYGLAAAIQYPDARNIWVGYDLLRYDYVATKFTREDNVATYRYLQDILRRILASDGSEEKLNPECRWCIRALHCDTLRKHALAGGVLSITDPHQAADLRANLQYAQDALGVKIRELDEFILLHAEQEMLEEYRTENTIVKVDISNRRNIDSRMAARILGPEYMAEYGELRMADVDRILKDPEVPSDKKAQLKQLITRKSGAPRIKTTPITPLHED